MNNHQEPKLNQVGTYSFVDIVWSLSVKALTVGIIYFAGYCNISPFWLLCPVAISVMKDQYEAEKQFRQQLAFVACLKNEEQLLVSNTDLLPTWVSFPDTERCEWINNVLAKLWPNINRFVLDVLKSSIEPKVNEILSGYVRDSFRFNILSLGSVPPRITGIKAYDKGITRKQIVIDFNIFYAGDCHFSFVFLGLKGGIKNFQIRGPIRIVMKPLISSLPLIGGIDIFFVQKPILDFNLVGVVDLLDMPGINGKLRQIVDDQIGMKMLQPNKIHIPLVLPDGLLSDFNALEYEGVLCVNVVEAKELVTNDVSFFKKGKSDPYVVVSVGEQVFTSPVVFNSKDPKWDFWAEFIIETLYGEYMKISVLDKDFVKEDSPLGNISLDISLVKQKGNLNTWIQLENITSGVLNLSLFFFYPSANYTDYCFPREPYNLSSSLLIVNVDSALNLVNPQSSRTPNAVAQLSVGNNIKTSKTVSSFSPVFDETITFLVHNPELDKLKVQLVDENTKTVMGHTSIGLKQILECNGMKKLDQLCALEDSATDSTLLLSLKIRVLKSL